MEENIAEKLEESGIKIGNPEEEQEPKISLPAPPERSRFFGQPKNWFKGAGYLFNLNRMQELYSQQEFHRIALKEVKNALGSRCKHLIHMKNSKGEVKFRAKLLIDGKIQVFNVTAESTNPDDFTAETYKAVNDVLRKHLDGNKGSKKAV